MKTTRRNIQFVFTVLLSMLLSACLSDLFNSDSGFSINITSPADVSMIQTPDIIVNLSGTADSEEDIEIVTWKNNRGGNGAATGKENWVTGNIVLQLGANEITITAKDVKGRTASKIVTVERGDTTSTGNGEPAVMYSYQSDLSNAAPVAGATIFPQPIYLFVILGEDWLGQDIARINYLCCSGQSGPGIGESYGPLQFVSREPWELSVDLTGLAVDGTRRMEIWAEYTGSTESDHVLFDFTVASEQFGSDNAPIIAGSPSTIATAGNQYSFRPTAQDPDGDTIGFAIQNQPAWASFNQITGRLIGTPTANDVGTYSSIVISASDGITSSRLSAFSITVEAFANGSVTLTWIAPTERIDNTPLTNLAGFNIYYGQTPGDYGNKVSLNNPGIATHVVENLSSGIWYFVVTARDANGLESNPSNEGSKSL